MNKVSWDARLVGTKRNRLIELIQRVGADPYTIKMWEKGSGVGILVNNVRSFVANIIKQEALASDIDAIVHLGCIDCSVPTSDVLIIGSRRGVKFLADRLRPQQFNLSGLSDTILNLLAEHGDFVLSKGKKQIVLSVPAVMGILNCTPDSFSDGGSYLDEKAMMKRVDSIIEEGGNIIDIGGVSTRPSVQRGQDPIPTEEEELRRILPAVMYAVDRCKDTNIMVSVDTFRSSVAKRCLAEGVDMINDQTAFFEPGMADVCVAADAVVSLMYLGDLKSFPDFMHNAPLNAIKMGVKESNIILDPGFGFGKTLEEQFYIMKNLHEVCSIKYPILVGLSRKSIIGSAVDKPVKDRDFATLSAEVLAMVAGAKIIRTHNVGACVDAVNVYKKVRI